MKTKNSISAYVQCGRKCPTPMFIESHYVVCFHTDSLNTNTSEQAEIGYIPLVDVRRDYCLNLYSNRNTEKYMLLQVIQTSN